MINKKEVITQIANDGTEFKSKEKCLLYKKRIKDIVENIKIYNKFKELIEINCVGDILYNIQKGFVDYIVILNDEVVETFHRKREKCIDYDSDGLDDISKAGMYIYNTDKEKWCNILDVIIKKEEEVKNLKNLYSEMYTK